MYFHSRAGFLQAVFPVLLAATATPAQDRARPGAARGFSPQRIARPSLAAQRAWRIAEANC